jgi:transposase InsO family protein
MVWDCYELSNGPEFTARAIRKWLGRMNVKTLFIVPCSPWENGYIESFNGKLRDELLNGEIFTKLTEDKVLIEDWRKEYNQVRPYSAKGYKPPVPEAGLGGTWCRLTFNTLIDGTSELNIEYPTYSDAK